MALSLLCGGLGVAEAAVVHVDEVPGGTKAVYTTDETYTMTQADAKYATQAALGDYAKSAEVYSKTEADAKYATQAALGDYAKSAEVYSKTEADAKYATQAALGDYAKSAEVYSKTEADAKYATQTALGDYAKSADVNNALSAKADKMDLDTANGRIDALQTKTTGLSPDGKSLTGMDKVETGALTVKGEISNGTVTTTLTAINDSIKQTGDNKTAIDKLNEKTAEISHEAGGGTNISGVKIKDGNILGNGNSAITGLTNVGTLSINGKNLEGNMVATEKDVADAVKAETDARTEADNKLEEKITKNSQDIATLNDKVTTAQGDIQTNANNIQANSKAIADTNKRTGGIARNLEDTQTTIEGKVTVNNSGDVGGVKGLSAETIKTTGGAEIGGALTVTGESNLKNTTVGGALTANGEATFEKNVTAEKDLTVNGTLKTKDVTAETIYISKSENTPEYKSEGSIIGEGGNLSVSNKKTDNRTNITKESQLNVNEEGTVNWATSTDGATGNVTEGRSEVTADNIKNSVKKTEGGKTFGYEENITADGKVGTVTDKEGNTSTTRQDSKGIYGYAKDKDGNKSYTKQEGNRIAESVIGQDGKQTKSEMTSTDITNTAKDGTITNTAKNVTNEGTESVTNKVGNNEVKVSKDGVDIKAEAGKKITESVGTASRVVENDKITDNAGDSTVTTEKDKGTTFGKAGSTDTTNIYGDSIKTGTINAKDTTTDKLTAGAAADANGGRLTVDANDGVKGSYKSGKYTSRSYILENTLKSGVDNGKDITDNGFVGSRTDHYMDGDKAKLNETVKDADGSNVTKKTSTKTYTEIKDTNGNTLSVNQKADGNNYKLEDQDGNTNHVTNSATQSKQTLKDKDGNTLTTNQTATKNNFDLKSADGSKENHTTNTVDESRVAIKGENGKAELSTTDEGTTFKHSAAKEAFTEGGATNTTIKGNTITTGKVTMDYADVMKDLGVYGNTTLGEAGKDTTLTVNSKATFNEIATFENGAEVKNGLTVSSGGLNVTGESTFNDKVNMKNGLDVTGGVASDSFTVKGTDIKIDSSGINAGGTVISNVADGSISEGSKDAVNGGQLYQVKNDLEGKVNKVGANAAAMANLHPMEFDPDSKWNIAAAIGNYGSETAAALGAFYRPNDDVMVNLSTAFGTGENMVGGGVSVRLGKSGNKLSREESNALKDQVNDLTARMDALLSVLNPNMSKDFPDVPENHWAYEAVSRLAGNDIVQGYPDGEFHGERTMTRYEMAEIIYNALSRGAEAEKELVEEFKPELQAMAASEKATAERAEG